MYEWFLGKREKEKKRKEKGHKMNLIFNTPVEEVIKERISVRTYSGQPITEETKKKIGDYAETVTNPFDAKITFKLLESDAALNAAKLGTYGFIKGAKNYIGASVQESELELEGLGYAFEKMILYITSLGLGTCWLGGTFKRSEFAAAMSIKKDELFPCVTPFGFAAEKKRMTDSMVRMIAKSDTRKPWSELFFDQNFTTPLLTNEAGDYERPLEMVRLAPSASNKQPWRIVKDKNAYHFFEYKTPGYSSKFGYDIQRLDLGIAACHFHLTAVERELNGRFQVVEQPIEQLPENVSYQFSWITE